MFEGICFIRVPWLAGVFRRNAICSQLGIFSAISLAHFSPPPSALLVLVFRCLFFFSFVSFHFVFFPGGFSFLSLSLSLSLLALVSALRREFYPRAALNYELQSPQSRVKHRAKGYLELQIHAATLRRRAIPLSSNSLALADFAFGPRTACFLPMRIFVH